MEAALPYSRSAVLRLPIDSSAMPILMWILTSSSPS